VVVGGGAAEPAPGIDSVEQADNTRHAEKRSG